MNLYELNKVVKKYDDNIVLKIPKLTVKAGQLTAIVGNSGSGKTTLLHTLGLITSTTTGTVVFDGENVTMASNKRIERYYQKNVDIIFQEYNLIENLSVIENLTILKHINKAINSQLIDETLNQLKIKGLGDQLVSNLSGGEMQRVAIARSLLKATDVILADEPTGALDIENTTEVMRIFREIVKSGKSIVFVTHDLNSAAKADQIYVLSDGFVIDQLQGGKPQTLNQLEKIFMNIEGAKNV